MTNSFKIWLESINRKLYHGTTGNFDNFDINLAGSRDYGDFGLGVYMTPSSTLAISYANSAARTNGQEPMVFVIQHSLQNPANFDDSEFKSKVFESLGIPMDKEINSGQKQTRPKEDAIAISKFVTSLGHDCATARGGKEFIAYDTSKLQIVEKIPAKDARNRILL